MTLWRMTRPKPKICINVFCDAIMHVDILLFSIHILISVFPPIKINFLKFGFTSY